jgi:hypothetical protein
MSVLENVVSNFSVHTPLDKITRAVTLHTTIVSIKGSSIETTPWSIDLFFEDACAIGEEP